jgi:STE24 endopeptidase
MSARLTLVVLAALALVSAALLGYLSRAPASLRRSDPPRGAADPSNATSFSMLAKRRAAAYSAASYAGFLIGAVLRVTVLIVLALGLWRTIVGALEALPGGWPVHAALLGCVVVVLMAAATWPLAYVRGFVIEHAWGLSTQGAGGWITDRLRSLAVGCCTTAVAAVAFYAIVRWQPRTWWLWGWAAFALLTVLAVRLWPVVVAPLFNRFTPLRETALAEAVTGMAQRAGVDIDSVLVADASRRTRAQNAYVAGLGETKRLVLYDTLLDGGDRRETLWIVGHELGHAASGHVLKGVALSTAGLLAGFGALAWLAERPGAWAWAGATGVADFRALPVLLLFVTVAGILGLPVENGIARGFERRADAIAVELTGDSDAAVRALRRLALRNIADLEPPWWARVLLYSHPPIPERIRLALARTTEDVFETPSGNVSAQ